MVGARELFKSPFYSVWKHRTVLLRTTFIEVRNLYAGSLLGASWVVIGQILMLAIYTLTYVVIFRIRPIDMTVYEYILYVFCGLTSYMPFSASLTGGALSLVSNRAVLLNTTFPAELIPFRSVLVASVTMPIGVLILLVSDAAFSELTWTSLLIPVVMVLQLMFAAGLVWGLSLLALIVRDVQQMLTYIIMMLMMITPIAYTPSMLPASLKVLIYLNPLAYFVITFQELIILNKVPSLAFIVVMSAMSIATFCGGFLLMRRAKSAFYDHA